MLVLAGCTSDDDSGPEAEPAPGPSSESSAESAAGATVSGDYDTVVELLDSTCDGIEVADNETTVEQDGDSVTLIHSGVSYVGPLREDGSFATAAVEVRVGTEVHALAVAGTFKDDGFKAQVLAEVTGSQTCGYTVAWTGTKQ